MDDRSIVDLYFARNEEAITETKKKYGASLLSFAFRLIGNESDAEECVNDTYLCAWQTIPPASPGSLGSFLNAICRGRALDKARKRYAEKRGGGTYASAYEEMEEFIADPTGNDPADSIALRDAFAQYLRQLGEEDRALFIGRYYYMRSIRDMAVQLNISESNVKIRLMRLRCKLKKHLENAGFDV